MPRKESHCIRGNGMKFFKKLAGMVLAVGLMVPMIGIGAYAAGGVLMYTDPSTKVGENVDIDLVVQSNSGETVGDVQVNMTYDPATLEFVSGEGFTADGSGALTYQGTGDGAELRETVTFRALQTGEARLTVDSPAASLASGETLELQQGSSTVTIEAADDGTTSVEPSGTSGTGETTEATGQTTDIVVSVNGTDYNFSEAFTGNDIPGGFTETTLTFNGGERRFAANEAGVTLGYLVDASGAGSFFLFNTEDATFSPFVQLNISDTTSIVPMNATDSVSLPDTYQQVELTVQDQIYPAWSDPMAPRYYVIYALNTRTGENALYQYDTDDGTYQYFIAPAEDEEASTGLPIPGRLGELINNHLMIVMIIIGLIGLILFILMIVFAVKLVHRNQELDDLYDEYDIPLDGEDEIETEKKPKKSENKAPAEPADDGYDDEYDDEYDDGYDDEYDDEYDDGYDDDYEDRQATAKIRKKGRKQKGASDQDAYDIDFIDI